MDSGPGPREARPSTHLSRRHLLALGAALPAGALLARAARGQFSEAPLAPREARGNLQHRFWKDLLEDFPLEPGERYFASADQGITPLQTLEQMHRAATELAAHAATQTADLVESARTTAARFFAADAKEIALMGDATGAMAALAESLPLPVGAVVALSAHEPPSTFTPWVALARAGRVKLRPFAPRPQTPVWRSALAGSAVLVTSQVSPTTGEILPLKEVCDAARKQGVRVVVNGSLAAGMLPVDLHDLGVDGYVAAGSGFLLGPQGTALLYLRQELLPRVVPRYRRVDDTTTSEMPAMAGIDAARELELEARSPALATGLASSLEWLAGLGLEVVREHATLLSQHLVEGLSGIGGIELLSTPESAALFPLVGIRVTRRPYTQVGAWLRTELAVRVHPVATPGLNSVRASTHLVNRKADVEQLVEGIRRLALA